MSTLWNYDLTVGAPDLTAHTGLLLAEDDALKTYLEGIQVPEKDQLVPVDVWFRYPEGERRIKYPFITIDWLGIDPAYDRWTSQWKVPADYCRYLDPLTGSETGRGMYVPSVAPTLPDLTDPAVMGYDIDAPLMHTLTYQVSVFSRSSLHDRYLQSRFITDIFPPRPFFLPVDADMTWRRCTLIEFTPGDTYESTDSGQKRIFRKIYTITVDAEIPYTKVREVFKVLSLHADIYDGVSGPRESPTHASDSPHDIAAENVTVVPPPGP